MTETNEIFENKINLRKKLFALHGHRRERHKLEKTSRIDHLTGVLNARGFERELGKGVAYAARKGENYSVVFIDLNKFKAVNDTYGHLVGDMVLKTFAKKLQEVVKNTDSVARIGGDEFVVLMPNSNKEDTERLIEERFKKGPFSKLSVPMLSGEAIKIEASYGSATFPGQVKNAEELLIMADAHMYRNKKNA